MYGRLFKPETASCILSVLQLHQSHLLEGFKFAMHAPNTVYVYFGRNIKSDFVKTFTESKIVLKLAETLHIQNN